MLSTFQVNNKCAKQKNTNVTFKLGSITNIPYPDSFFDCVVSIGGIQSFNGPIDSALDEMLRVLDDNGILFLATLDSEYIGFKSGDAKMNLHNTYFIPEELNRVVEQKKCTIIESGSIVVKDGVILPLHQSHTFFILARKNE